MLSMGLAEITLACRGRTAGAQANASARGISTDSRSIAAESLFVALKGERFDGHDHVAGAFEKGAHACVVSHAYARSHPDPRLIAVGDTYQALGDIGHAWRKRFTMPVVALTGSNGKTTVKEMLRSILVCHHAQEPKAVLATEGNFNNHIGVPLTLARLSASHKVAVVEAGMNHHGEIAYLTRKIAPDVALVNNAGPAHLEGVGSIEGVAHAKAEIFEGLGPQGTAVYNADDAQMPIWRARTAVLRSVTFGTVAQADVRGAWSGVRAGDAITIHYAGAAQSFTLALAGTHNRMNTLAAAAGALALDVPLHTVAEGLRAFRGVSGRQAIVAGLHGSIVIDDTYNANPASMQAAIETLCGYTTRKIIVLGQMAELGADSDALHRQVGASVASSDIDCFFAVGARMQAAVAACGSKAHWFETKAALIAQLKKDLGTGVVVLVKGAHSMAMEEVVAAISEPTPNQDHGPRGQH
jgi:UDP-N-acetylmuramoyl-tripeptide--D-alanyl-D-alanine ligase